MKTKDMVDLLESHGYSQKRQQGSHIILKNPTYDSVIVLQDSSKELKPYILSSIKRNIVEKGVMTAKEFINALANKGVYQIS